jgi:hypothetical protein
MAGYGDNAGFTAYATGNGYVIPDGTTDAQITAARQRGSMVVDRYEPRFTGSRTAGFAQERAWPRTGASTYYGEDIPSASIPVAIVNASYEAAFLEVVSPGSLSPVIVGSATVKREKVGPLEVEYSSSTNMTVEQMVAMSTPIVTAIDGLLWPFLYQPLPAIMVV